MKKITTEIIIIFILWLSVILSLYLNYKFDIFFIFGIIGLSIVTLTNKKLTEISLTILIVILLFASFSLIKFSLAFGLNFGVISIPNFILLIVLLYRKRNQVLDLKEKWFVEDEEEIENGKKRKTEFFKNQFKNLTEKELNRKLSEEKLTEEAKNAIIELLKVEKNITEK
jgi:predicted membrane protein